MVASRVISRISGVGHSLPPNRISNHEIAERLARDGIETSDEWIVSRTGIRARHFADPSVRTSDLAAAAAREALDHAGIPQDDVGLIIVATSTPDHLGGFPSTACRVQAKLGITNGSAAFDVQAVCTGFVYALSIADGMVRNGLCRHALVIGAEVFSRILDFRDRRTCVLFGDGAGAVVLSRSPDPGVLSSSLGADGRYADALCIPGNVKDGELTGLPCLTMDGPVIFRLGIAAMEAASREALDAAGRSIRDVSWLVPHQANVRIMHGAAGRLGLPAEQVVVTVDEHGNTSAASIPLALSVSIRNDQVRPGQTVVLPAVGGGLTWGAVVARL